MALLLTWEAGLVPEEGFSLYGKITALGLSYDKEPAGHIFHQVALKQHGLHKDDEDRADDSSSSESGKMSGPSHASSLNDFSSLDQDSGSSKYKGKGKKKNLKKRGVDVYALLGLQYERWMASADQIKNAYRRSALLHHPDKQGIDSSDEAAKQAAEEKFKAIQEAYETLSDASRRREFDSLDDFDDSLPGVLSDGADFYMIFGSAFARNARWASKKPVPELGNDQTPYRDVDKFYDYWYGFKSWREFPHPDEEDVEGAECREHRRLIERHNNKLREQGRRAEAKRLRELVESAARQDPRLARRRAEEKAAKEARRLAKENERLARVRAEEEEKAAEAAAAAKEAEEQAQRKREAAAGRKALKNERSLLRKLVAANEALQSCAGEGGAEKLSTTLSLEELRALNKELRDKEAPEEARVRALNERMGGLRLEAEREEAARAAAVAAAEKAAAERAQREGAARQASLASWSDEEVRLLQKALEKWPPGTIKRWNVIQGYLQTRTAEEITVMVKHGLKARAAALVSDGYEVAAKRQGNTIIQSEATDRLASFTDVQIPREEDNNSSTDQQLNGTTWTPEAELALIKALKVVKKDAEDRWGAVADLVPGKTKAQCFLRFKEMKAAHKSKPN